MGLATAEALASIGWKVSIVDLNKEAGDIAAKKIGGLYTQANVSIYEELGNAFSRTWKEYGRLDFGKNFSCL